MSGDVGGKRLDQLVEVLFDKTARLDERDDAAVHLGRVDDPRALQALVDRASDPREDDAVVGSAGESIAAIWLRRGNYDPRILEGLRREPRAEIEALISQQRPEWLAGRDSTA
ncbi:MAG TPA: hypothetical protein VIT43_10080 [Candidatus Dormibacteraeota bacterium]